MELKDSRFDFFGVLEPKEIKYMNIAPLPVYASKSDEKDEFIYSISLVLSSTVLV